jgi:uncharacterized membrane protein
MSIAVSPDRIETVERTPFHALLVPFPAVAFTFALFTDLAYWQSNGEIQWTNFSAWLLFAGLVFGGLALVIGLLGLLFRRRRAGRGPVWFRAVGGLAVLVLATVNSFVHAGDGWTSVVPWGLTLSAITVALIVILALVERTRTVRHGVVHHA